VAAVARVERAQHPVAVETAAREIVRHAYDAGSTDNLTAQIVRIEAAPEDGPADLAGRVAEATVAPVSESSAR
jgi:serine/threonine protein phosphatase PrpC